MLVIIQMGWYLVTQVRNQGYSLLVRHCSVWVRIGHIFLKVCFEDIVEDIRKTVGVTAHLVFPYLGPSLLESVITCPQARLKS